MTDMLTFSEGWRMIDESSNTRGGEEHMSTYDGPIGKARIVAQDDPKSPRIYDGEITGSDATSICILCVEHRTVDGLYWYGEVAYTIPWTKVIAVEQAIRKLS